MSEDQLMEQLDVLLGTAAVAVVVLRDVAHLQEEDAAHARGSRHDLPLPLFGSARRC